MKRFVLTSLTVIALTAVGCTTPKEGPDKALAGAVLGAGWGAGAGAVVGNQLEYGPTGEGAAIGAGFGLVSGAASGLMYDSIEDTQIEQEKELASLRVQNMANSQQLQSLQHQLDEKISHGAIGGIYQVFFDSDSTSMRAGSSASLEVIADSLRTSPAAYRIHVIGHSDDSGTPQYNSQIAEARARAVSGYLASRGLSMGQLVVESHGSERPIASNSTPTGRQLNRRVDIFIQQAAS